MSAFRDLLKEAHSKGIRQMAFTVDLDDFFRDDQADSWMAFAADHPSERGRTGEEALRQLVGRIPGPGPE